MSKVVIGIPCYQDVSNETLEDYMRFAYYLGRRCTDHDFFLAIKPKSEQFRARNAIVEAALQVDAKYLLFLDDDHVINWESGFSTSDRYGFVETLIGHMEKDPKMGVCGALYYHRGGECRPVLMTVNKDGSHRYLRDDEIEGRLQQVDVQGGGCMLLNMNMFSVIPSPWFEPEKSLGTDLQICEKARDHGFTVWCDTSIVIGHVLNKREIVTPKNRHRLMSESNKVPVDKSTFIEGYQAGSAMNLFRLDVQEYLGKTWEEVEAIALSYNDKNMPRFDDYEDPREYYKSLGPEQIARQAWFHSHANMLEQMEAILNTIDTTRPGYGVDYGCGSSPVGMELVLKGHRMDFIDIDGTPAYEFLKHRAEKRGVAHRCGWELKGPYDYALFLDSIEHFANWEKVLGDVIGRIKDGGVIVTNYFFNVDFYNPEHISMDHDAVKKFLVNNNMYPINLVVWMKRELGLKEAAA